MGLNEITPEMQDVVNNEITPEDEERAKTVIKTLQAQRATECLAKIEALCKECGATLVPYMIIVGGQVVEHGIRLDVVGEAQKAG